MTIIIKRTRTRRFMPFFIHEDNSKRCSFRNLKKIVNKSDVHFAVNDDYAYLLITHFDAQTTLCRLMFINNNNYKNNNDNNNKKNKNKKIHALFYP